MNSASTSGIPFRHMCSFFAQRRAEIERQKSQISSSLSLRKSLSEFYGLRGLQHDSAAESRRFLDQEVRTARCETESGIVDLPQHSTALSQQVDSPDGIITQADQSMSEPNCALSRFDEDERLGTNRRDQSLAKSEESRGGNIVSFEVK